MTDNQSHVFEAPSPIHGMGIFAGRDFYQEERVVAIDDSQIVPEGSPDVDADGNRLYYDDISGRRVVRLGPLQYTNHSCDFSTYAKAIEGIRYRIARRDIRGGEEITSHYSINARFGSEWECYCGGVNCLERLVHDYFALPLHLQVEYLPFLDDWFVEENQGMIRKLRRDAKADLRK